MQLITHRQQGFTLLEVMVALFVLSVGLLGVVKLEALAYSSTNIASKRSLAALEAASLAASMHVNRGYWTTPDASGATIVVNAATVAPNGVAVTAAAPLLGAIAGVLQDCKTATPCLPVNMAAYDLQQWAVALGLGMGSAQTTTVATINCGTANPVSCMINIVWAENTVNMSAQETGALASPSYTLYVEP
jgi:type IV pilus assembly protein PilV